MLPWNLAQATLIMWQQELTQKQQQFCEKDNSARIEKSRAFFYCFLNFRLAAFLLSLKIMTFIYTLKKKYDTFDSLWT